MKSPRGPNHCKKERIQSSGSASLKCICVMTNTLVWLFACLKPNMFFFFDHRSKVDMIQEIVTGNPTVIKMVVSFNRGARGQNALRQILSPVVKEIMDDKSLNIKTDPVDIYKSWVNQMESQTGEAR